MTDEILVPGGIHGTRKLAAALATVILRNRGMLNKYPAWGELQRKWTPEELARAKQMAAAGNNYAEIGRMIGRDRQSVREKLSPKRAA